MVDSEYRRLGAILCRLELSEKIPSPPDDDDNDDGDDGCDEHYRAQAYYKLFFDSGSPAS